MSEGKHVRLEQEGKTLIVSPLFTFSRFTEGDLVGEWNRILQTIDGQAVKDVVVDLGYIPYFGSTLLDWMVQMWKRVQQKGGTLASAILPRSAAKFLASLASTSCGASSDRGMRRLSRWRKTEFQVPSSKFKVGRGCQLWILDDVLANPRLRT